MKKIYASVLFFCAVLIINTVNVYASSLPFTALIPAEGYGVWSVAQPLYEPTKIIIDDSKKKIEDLCIYEDLLYVVDSKGKYISVYDLDGNEIEIIGEGILNSPAGVFVDANYIYVADYGLSEVVKFDKSGEVVDKFGRPDSPLFGLRESFKPQKIVVNSAEDMFVISEGGTSGIVQLNKLGEFSGYYGVNTSKVSLTMIWQRMFYTKEQRAQVLMIKPPSPNALTIDSNGIIYTLTKGADESEIIKKLNISGNNMFSGTWGFSDSADIAVDKSGNIFVLTEYGSISVYDSFGNMLGYITPNDKASEREGVFKQPAAIEMDANNLMYIADKDRGTVTVLEPTEICNLMYRGIEFYKDGKYVESMDIWNEVLTLNTNFSLAHEALGKAYFKLGDYERALEEFQMCKNMQGYSNAYWQIRNNSIQAGFGIVCIILLVLYVLSRVLKYIDRKKNIFEPFRTIWSRYKESRFYRELRALIYILKNPIDCCDYIKRLKKVSLLGFLGMTALLIIQQVLSAYYKGFLFAGYNYRENINVNEIIILILLPLGIFIISNYLVSTITDGEGSFKNVMIGSVVALSPLILFGLPVSLLTNVLTENEVFLYSFSMFVITLWCGINFFVVVKEIHNYSTWETIKNIFLTIVGMIIILLVVFIMYVLLDQIFQFIINFR